MSDKSNEQKFMEALSSIQSELFVPKGQKNDFGKYNYRSCEDILVAVKPLCEKYRCILTLGDAIPEEIGGRIYIKVNVRLTDIDTGVSKETTAYAREEETKKGMDGSQITGASISYARKYALASLFCIDNEKDSDATSTKSKDGSEVVKNEETGEEEKTLTATQINAIYAEIERTGISTDKILATVKKDKVELMTQKDYIKVMKSFKVTPDKKEEK